MPHLAFGAFCRENTRVFNRVDKGIAARLAAGGGGIQAGAGLSSSSADCRGRLHVAMRRTREDSCRPIERVKPDSLLWWPRSGGAYVDADHFCVEALFSLNMSSEMAARGFGLRRREGPGARGWSGRGHRLAPSLQPHARLNRDTSTGARAFCGRLRRFKSVCVAISLAMSVAVHVCHATMDQVFFVSVCRREAVGVAAVMQRLR